MLIRCEKCSTLYELDDKLVPPQGAPVQCGRCQYVFTVRPERPAAEPAPVAPAPASQAEKNEGAASSSATATPAATPTATTAPAPTSTATPTPTSTATSTRAPAPPAAPTPAPTAGPAPTPTRTAAATVTPPAPSSTTAQVNPPSQPASPIPAPTPPPPSAFEVEEPRFTADGRPIRKVSFPEEDLKPSGPRPVIARAPGSVGTGGRVRRTELPVVPIVVGLIVVALLFVAWRVFGRRVDPSAAQRRAEGQQLVLRDDRASLTRAIVAFDDAARVDEGFVDARADRVLARALLLGLVQGEAARIDARLAAREAERTRTDAPVGPPVPELREEIDALKAQREAVRARLRELEGVASSELAPLQRDADRPSVQRARAVLEAYATDPARAAEAVLRDRPARGKDPWLDLAVGVGETRAMSPELRAEGVARLEALVKAHPELLRGRLALSEALARAGRADAAVASLDALLAANRDHDDARALRAELTAGEIHGGAAAPVPGTRAPPAGTTAPHPRNQSSQAQAAPEP